MITESVTYILDANVLLRLADAQHPQHGVARNITQTLRANGATLRTIPQALFEFWTVATRDADKNGLGLTVSEAAKFIGLFTQAYWPIPDDPAILANWRRLVVKYNIVGKHGHDARYIASMQAHGLTHLVTFDNGFNRYSPEGIVVTIPTPGTVAVDGS